MSMPTKSTSRLAQYYRTLTLFCFQILVQLVRKKAPWACVVAVGQGSAQRQATLVPLFLEAHVLFPQMKLGSACSAASCHRVIWFIRHARVHHACCQKGPLLVVAHPKKTIFLPSMPKKKRPASRPAGMNQIHHEYLSSEPCTSLSLWPRFPFTRALLAASASTKWKRATEGSGKKAASQS